MAVVLGVNGVDGHGHDAGAALAVNGRLVAAVEEERLVRVKRAFGLPPLRAIREVLALAGYTMSDVDTIAYPWEPATMGVPDDDITARLDYWCRTVDPDAGRTPDPRFIPHHEAHAWAGLAFTPFDLRSQTGVIVLDGSGESTSGACYRLCGGRLEQLWSLPQHSSVGIFYEAVTQYLGFRWGDEGKTMGLAAYGRDRALAKTHPGMSDDRAPVAPPFTSATSPRRRHEELRAQIVAELVALHGERLSFNQRADVAFAAQHWLEERVLQYVAELVNGLRALVLSGGVALNCTANSKVAAYCRRHDVQLVIPPTASDTGVALGAAVAASPDPAAFTLCDEVALGRAFPPELIIKQLRTVGLPVVQCEPADIVRALTSGTICGWLEGGSEIGPRSLGHRSIVARPDSTPVRDRLNVLKGRESWRPLAPSLTPDEFTRNFPNSSPSPYMLIAATYDPLVPGGLEGVVHVDGTARPQVVHTDGVYRNLIMAMGAEIGTEALVCTSFNRAGEPLVYTSADAVLSAKHMGLDLLAGDGWMAPL